MSEWQVKPLAELADIRISNVDKKSVLDELPVRLCNYMDVYAGRYLVNGDRYMEATCTTRELAAFGLRRGDVLITKDSESPDDIAIPALIDDDVQELVCGYHLAVLRLKSNEIDPIVLLKQLESERLRRYFGQRAGGSTRYGLSTRAISQAPILVPPEEIQRRIGEIHRSLDTQITHTEALIAKQEQVRAGLMQDLFTRGVDETGRLRPPREEAPELYHETALGWLPKGWEVRSAERMCSVIIDCKNRTPPPADEGYPVFRTPNVRDGCFIEEDLGWTDRKSFEQWTKRGRPQPGDILFTREAPVGEVCLVPEEYPEGCLGQRMMLYRASYDEISPLFLLYALQCRSVQAKLKKIAGGSTVGHVRVGDVRTLLIPWCIPSEQEKITPVLYQSELQRRTEQKMLNVSQNLRTALLCDLLTPPAYAAAEPRIAAE